MHENDIDDVKRLLERRNNEINIIEKVASKINKSLDMDAIANTMLESMHEYFDFEHSMILLVDQNEGSLKVIATYGYDDQGIGAEVKIGVGVIGMVAKKKKLMRLGNMGAQKQYVNAIKEQVQPVNKGKPLDEIVLPGLQNAESQVAIPMLIENELIGVFSVESDRVNIFDKSDELIIKILANQTASALQNAKLYNLEQQRLRELDRAHAELADLNLNLEKKVSDRTEELVALSEKLSKYFSPQVYDSIFSGELDVKIQTQRKPLTVFFCDLQGFTHLTEKLEPEILTEILTEYLTAMSRIAINWGGTIDKYIGDAMMVFFGDPDSKGEREDARACVRMALKMQEKISILQAKWQKQGFSDPFQIRMGMNTGYCNVGNFGSEQRLTYTIIGSEVNIAQRLEASAPSGGILMSYETYAHAQDMIEVEQLESISMKGVKREIKVFSVLNRLKQGNKKKATSPKIMTVSERIGDRLDALETKIEEILLRIK